jgi:hypothetical protein
MKKRNGFVSNSSSCSFTCDICGNTESGIDLCMSDIEMFSCANCGRTMDETCAKVPDSDKEEFTEALCDDRYAVPAKFCPFCKLETLADNSFISYVCIKFGITRESILDEIKKTFNTYDNFTKYLVESKSK